MDIPGVPESIPRTQMLEMLASLGLDPKDLISFRVEWNAITAEVFALNEKGSRYVADGSDSIATHSIAIPITD